MPRSYDKFPQRRQNTDHNPLANLLQWQSVTRQTAQSTGEAINSGIAKGSQQAASDSSNNLAAGLQQLWFSFQATMNSLTGTLDADWTDFVDALQATEAGSADALAKWQTVLNDLGLGSVIDLAAWFGQSASGVYATNISSSVITDGPQQLLPNPNFSGAISVTGNGIWSWDSTVYFLPPGQAVTNPGAAKVTANGVMQVLESVATVGPLPLGQPISYSVKVLQHGLTGSGNLVQLLAIPWIGNTPQTPVLIQQAGAPAGATTGWTNPPSGSHAAILSGSYTPTTVSGVTAVSMAVTVTDFATGGTVWFSAASEELTGGLISDIQNDESARQLAWATLWESWWTTATTPGQSIPSAIAAFDAALVTYQDTNDAINISESATVSQILSSLLGINLSTGQMNLSNVQGLTDYFNQLGAALAGDTSSAAGPWAWLGQLIDGYYTLTGQAHSTAVANANTLGIRNNATVIAGLDNTTVSNMPLPTVTLGASQAAISMGASSAQMWGASVRFPASGSFGALTFLVSTSSATTPPYFFVNVYVLNQTTMTLKYQFSSVSMASSITTAGVSAPKMVQFVFPSQLVVNAADVVFALFQGSAVASGSIQLWGSNGTIGQPPHPTALLKNIGAFSANPGSSHAAADILTANWQFANTAPYLAFEITSLAGSVFPDSPTPYPSPGTFTQTLDSWTNFVDLIGVGQGGGGQGETGSTVGRGASPGAWNGKTLVVGTDIAAGGTITVTVHANPSAAGTSDPASGGAYFSDGQDGASTTFQWTKPGVGTQTLTCAGGLGGGLHNGANTTTFGQGPGNFTFPATGPHAETYIGGAAQLTTAPGNPPGGSGPGGQPFQYGFNGAHGQGWIVERAT